MIRGNSKQSQNNKIKNKKSVSDFYDSCNVKEEKKQIKNLENIM